MWVDTVEQAEIPIGHIALMADASALSERLKANCSTLSVQVKSQELAPAFHDEQELLEIQEYNSLIRKVHLLGDGEPWIHGRVVVPHITYQAFQIEFDNMGDKLLGETLLYDRPNVTRSAFQYAHITDNLWARRSMFTIGTFKLLVTEVFLPAAVAKCSVAAVTE